MRWAALLLFAGSLAGQMPTGTIHGTVRDGGSGQPLAGFNVGAGRTATTDDQGRYAISDLAAGEYVFVASRYGRTPAVRKIKVKDGDDLTVDFEIPVNASVSGRVRDAAKQPLANVSVWMIGAQYRDGVIRHVTETSRATAKDGSFRFENVAPGHKFYLLADRAIPEKLDPEQPIEIPTYYGDATFLEGATPLTVRPGEQRENADIQVRRGPHHCVDGKIELSGVPAAMPFVIYERAIAESSSERVRSKSSGDGTFHACGLAPGDYQVMTFGPNGLYGASDFTVAGGDVHDLRVLLDTVPLRLEMAWDGPADPPKTPAAVILAGRAARSAKATVYPYAGPYSKEPLPAGDYVVELNFPTTCCYVKEMELNGIAFTNRRLHLAGTSGTLRIVLAPDPAIPTFQAIDAEGKPWQDASFFVLIPESAATASPIAALPDILTSDTLQQQRRPWQLAPGKYRALAVDRALQIPDDLDQLWKALSQAMPVELAPGARPTIILSVVSID